jgi:hypothetical protein
MRRNGTVCRTSACRERSARYAEDQQRRRRQGQNTDLSKRAPTLSFRCCTCSEGLFTPSDLRICIVSCSSPHTCNRTGKNAQQPFLKQIQIRSSCSCSQGEIHLIPARENCSHIFFHQQGRSNAQRVTESSMVSQNHIFILIAEVTSVCDAGTILLRFICALSNFEGRST